MSMSIGTVFITVVGQCMGANDIEAADWYMRKLTRLSILLATVWNVLVMALTPLLLPLYDLTAETKHLILIIVTIAKLAPQAVVAPGLSVHYSGGSGLPNDIRTWLESQGIPTNQ